MPPTIDSSIPSPASPQVLIDRSIILDCLASGVPVPSIEWQLNGQPLRTPGHLDGERADAPIGQHDRDIVWQQGLDNYPPNVPIFNTRLTISDDQKRLTIVNAKVTDTGRYTCIVRNEAGVTDYDHDLEVIGE